MGGTTSTPEPPAKRARRDPGKSYPAYDADALRAAEFPHATGTYLDHAGAALVARSQSQAVARLLQEAIYANPHSQGPVASATRHRITTSRARVMAFFNASPDDYVLVFTAGATAGLKLVAECFPWGPGKTFFAARNSHNSVLGVREYALDAGAQYRTFSPDNPPRASPQDLVAWPAECNFSGRRADPALGSRTRAFSLLDAAKAAATAPLDLTAAAPTFCVVSFYKLFGFPTGLGALFVRRDAVGLLNKRYFGGGTVSASLADARFHAPRADPAAWLADGTEDFTGIIALQAGLDVLERLGMANVAAHTAAVARHLYEQLSALRHANGAPVAAIYGDWPEPQGPVVAFSLLRGDGAHVGYAEVERLAAVHGIQLRTGCFCNPGACQEFLGLSDENVRDNLEAGHECWDDMDLVDGRPTGAVRASVGYMTTYGDVEALVGFVGRYFVESGSPPPAAAAAAAVASPSCELTVQALTVFPIKSCSGVEVDAWPIGPRGLLMDREWAVVDYAGKPVRQKAVPALALVQPSLDARTQALRVDAPGQPQLDVSRASPEEVARWFTAALGMPCTLARREQEQATSFANDGMFLLLSQASVDGLNERLPAAEPRLPASRFRANIVVAGAPAAHAEDAWAAMTVGDVPFRADGPCSRCAMVNINQDSAEQAREPLLTLAKYRRDGGKIMFGQFVSVAPESVGEVLRVGDRVSPD